MTGAQVRVNAHALIWAMVVDVGGMPNGTYGAVLVIDDVGDAKKLAPLLTAADAGPRWLDLMLGPEHVATPPVRATLAQLDFGRRITATFELTCAKDAERLALLIYQRIRIHVSAAELEPAPQPRGQTPMDTARREFDVPFGIGIAHANLQRRDRGRPPLEVRADATSAWAFVPAQSDGPAELVVKRTTRGRSIGDGGRHLGPPPAELQAEIDRLGSEGLSLESTSPATASASLTDAHIGARVQHVPSGRFGEIVLLGSRTFGEGGAWATVAVDGDPRPLVDRVGTFRVVAPARSEPARTAASVAAEHRYDPAHDHDGIDPGHDDGPWHDGDGA